MAQLFQPTNITPDIRGVLGNGVVTDESANPPSSSYVPTIPVSWQINGNTAMTAFQIDFYKNDGSGDLIWSTGKLTTGCPAYSFDENGNASFFSYAVVMGSETGLQNYSEAQFVVTQFWGPSASNSIVQNTPSVYLFLPAMELTISGDDTVSGTSGSYSAIVSGGGDNPVLWHRWFLRRVGGDGNIADTGRVYGNTPLTFSYDGFIPGTYTVWIEAENSLGMYANAGFFVTVSRTEYDINMSLTAVKACGGENAVRVSWPALQSVPLSSASSGTYVINDEKMALTGTTTLIWDIVNGSPMSFGPGWSLIFKFDSMDGIIGGTFLRLDFQNSSNTTQYVEFAFEEADWTWIPQIAMEYQYYDLGSNSVVHDTVVVTSYMKMFEAEGNLFSILPDGFHIFDSYYNGCPNPPGENSWPFDFTSLKIKKVTIPIDGSNTPFNVSYLKILSNGLSNAEFESQYVNGDGREFGEDTVFLATGKFNTFNAGNFPIDDFSDSSYSFTLYRSVVGKTVLERVVTYASLATKPLSVLDYAAKSQQGPYIYTLYITAGTNQYYGYPIYSNEVDPCFWNWEVLSCTTDSTGAYLVRNAYLFANNVVSGSLSNSNKPNVLENFSPYPTVQLSPQNYKSGSLQSLIGSVDYTDCNNAYSDTVSLRDAIYNLSVTSNTLFLKDRKGSLWMIRPSGEITMDVMDETREQALTVQFPWVEIGDVSGLPIYSVLS